MNSYFYIDMKIDSIPRHTTWFFLGSRGVKYSQYDGIPGPSVSALRSNSKYPNNPDQRSVYPSFRTSPTQLQ